MSGPSTWKIDGTHTNVEFAVRHLMVSTVRGRFGTVEGTLLLDREHPANSHVDVTIDVASIDTRNEQRDGHLRSADFFDVENHPHLTFKSTSIVPAGGEKFKVHGDLSIRGVTHPVTLDAEVLGFNTSPWGKHVVGFEGKTTISRKQWGLEWNVALETGGVMVSDDVRITLEFEAIEEAA